jgi:hypothetical protein
MKKIIIAFKFGLHKFKVRSIHGVDNQKILRNMLKNTANYCNILQKYLKILQDTAKYCKLLQILHNTTKF